eukprot:CAMPEP_0184443286 /NCGR_PEP_ID=MMETSP0740-20130409/190_1 /TAXON_ID=385413 /ORGANISM="Thalassiosira miniscula, Strain CCMP1093" /LENGTH=181 /DNA_ID=CAMNT_0026811335 /DNA_START=19 /DNA_END=561 /DNA_ORIENTATION=+
MARVTVEDCVDKVPNRFELVMLAAHRAREIAAGSPLTVDRDNDKNPVVSLREIADETQSADDLRERLIESNQNQIEVDEPEEDAMALLMGGEEDKPEEDSMSEEMLLRQLMAAQGQGNPRAPAGGNEADGMNSADITADDLIALVQGYNPRTNEPLIRAAFDYGARMHEGQFRHSGEPYFT